MDTIQTTVAENALGKDIKHLASTATTTTTTVVAAADRSTSSTTTNMNSIAEKPDEYKITVNSPAPPPPAAAIADAGNGDDKKAIRTEDTDDLLDKIDEAVKDKNPNLETLDNDISQSSEHDFIKKLEEIENDGKEDVNDGVENLSPDDKDTKIECNSEKVVVGKLVLEVSSDNATKEEETASSSIKNDGNDIEKSNDNKVNTNITILPNDGGTIESITDDLSGIVNEMNSAKKDDMVQQQEVEVVQKDTKTIEDIENKTEINDPVQDSVPEKVASNLPIEIKSTESTALKQVQPPPVPVPSISIEATITSSEIQEKITETLTEITKDISKIVEVETNLNNVKDVKKNVELMSIDLTDSLSEPMDVDTEEKMDIDNDAIIEINDEEMKPASSETINIDQRLKNPIAETEIIKTTSKTEELIQEKSIEKLHENVPNKVENLKDSKNKLSQVKEKLTPIKKTNEMESNNIVEQQQQQLQSKNLSPPQKSTTLSQKITSCATSSINSSEVDVKLSTSPESTVTSNVSGVEKENNSQTTNDVKENLSTTHLSKSPVCKDTIQSDKNVEHSIIVTEKGNDEEKQKQSKELNESEHEQQNKIDSTKTIKVSPSPIKIDNHPPLMAKDSDSTASITSTTEEQIIKFGAETTIDLVEIDQQPLKKLENKPLLNAMKLCGSNSSLNTTPVSTAANVFNSTPIQKQFEISSENVSKISGATEISRTDKTVEDDGNNLNKSSSKHEYSSESVTCTSTGHQSSSTEHHSTSDHQKSDNQSSSSSSDGLKKYINFITKCNGLTDSGTDVENTVKIRSGGGVSLLSTTASSDLQKKDNLYEINVWYHQNDIAYLSIENLDLKKKSNVSLIHDSSEQGSSTNGSVTSLPQFTLPTAAPMPELSSSSSTVSDKTDGKSNTSSSVHTKNTKFTIQGLSGLCRFVIDEFTKIEKNINPSGAAAAAAATAAIEDVKTPKKSSGKYEDEENLEDEPKTPKSHSSKELIKKNLIKGGGKSVSDSSPSPVSRDRRGRKRSFTKTQSDDEDENKSKAKQPRKTPTSKTPGTPSAKESTVVVVGGGETSQCDLAGQCVLAKWVDKKYYAGKITGDKPGNKFIVLFEDGASKILPRESIVFGEGDLLPLKDRNIHALVDDDFENGIVLSIDKVDEKILYTVKAETKTVKVSASDIYLSDEQAKAIQNAQQEEKSETTDGTAVTVGVTSRPTRHKRASASPVVPEAGYSGGVAAKKGAKRQKRQQKPLGPPMNRISESSDMSDQQESIPPSPGYSYEFVEGVQPEQQCNEKESELSKMIFLADYLEMYPMSDPETMLGQLPESKVLFRNKCFILTCSVGFKPHRFVEVNESNADNQNRQFSKIPFVKNILRKQIEYGGGIVYNNFKEIPKSKYRQCKLIAPRPCMTANYIQCLAANIQAISHEWIIDSCYENTLQNIKDYSLPSGWSVLSESYINWPVGKLPNQRQSNHPFNKIIILIASEHQDFVKFWGNVCKQGGATVRYIKYINDITPTTKGYMVSDLDFPQIIKSKASHYGIPIVSTVWIVQSLIMGLVCPPDSSPKLTQMYLDDDY